MNRTRGTVFFNRIEHSFTSNMAAIQTGGMTPDKPWTSSYEITIWVMLAFMVAASVAATLLPMHPKYDDSVMAH